MVQVLSFRLISLISLLLLLGIVTTAVAGLGGDPLQVQDLTVNSDLRVTDIASEGDEVYVLVDNVDPRTGDGDVVYLLHFDGTAWKPKVQVSADNVTVACFGKVVVVDGTAHIVWTQATVHYYTHIMYRTFKDGQLGTPLNVSSDEYGGMWHPDVDGDGATIAVSWTIATGPMEEEMYCRIKEGSEWGDLLLVAARDTEGERLHYSSIAVSDDEVHVVWMEGTAYHYLVYHRSYDGASWSDKTLLSDGETERGSNHEPRIVAGDGDVHVTWSSDVGDPNTIWYCHSSEGIWHSAVALKDTAGSSLFRPSIAMDGEQVIIACAGASKDHPQSIHFAFNDGSCWSPVHSLTGTYEGPMQADPVVDLDGGRAHMAWDVVDGVNVSVRYACMNMGATEPVATLLPVPTYWIGREGIDLEYEAEDDYILANVTLLYRHGTNEGNWSTWQVMVDVPTTGRGSVQGCFTFVPAPVDSLYQIQAVARNVFGIVEPLGPPEVALGLDITPPNCSLRIEEDREVVGVPMVELQLTFEDLASGVTAMRLSSDGVFDDEDWTEPARTVAWTLTDDSGTKEVYLQVKDAAGHLSDIRSDEVVLDLDDPTCSVVIEEGREWVNLLAVELTIDSYDATSTVVEMRVGEDGIWDDEPWEPAHGSAPWTLSPHDGLKTVYVQVRDAGGRLSVTASSSILLDTTPPTVLTVDPADGSKGVGVDASITIVFSEPMDGGAIGDSRLVLDGVPVEGRYAIPSNNTTLTFHPNDPLEKGATYEVIVSPTALDAHGNHLTDAHFLTFETEKEVVEEPGGFPLWSIWVLVLALVLGAFLFIWRTGRWPRRPTSRGEP